ncbi:DUF3426 domain-containing protein [Sinobacterium caligoides]|nr:DUF3426 domain-containing protein [Sinobacterium caligoides]
MDTKVTQCPNCQTAFRVTGQQLTLAAGSVRCGSCLHIFQADTHWLDEEGNAPLLSNDSDKDDPLFDFKIGDDTVIPDHLSHEFAFDDDEDAAEDKPSQFSDSFINLKGIGESHSFNDIDVFESNSDNEDEGDEDEAWAKALLEEIEQSSAEELRAENHVAPPSTPPPATAQTSNSSNIAPAPEGGKEEGKEATCDNSLLSASAPISERQALVNAIESEPLELHHSRESRFPQAIWGGLSILALVVLLFQYAWFNMTELAHNPKLRPWYQQACSFIGCELPRLQDTNKIASHNLVVRPSADNPKLLNLDMIIINNATFAQPYPNIRITFSDMNNTLVSSRALSPGQYLRGELDGSRTMPPQRQIHIALKIISPSDDATNYRVSFEPTEKK